MRGRRGRREGGREGGRVCVECPYTTAIHLSLSLSLSIYRYRYEKQRIKRSHLEIKAVLRSYYELLRLYYSIVGVIKARTSASSAVISE